MEQRILAVDDFVVGEGKHEILAEGVEHREGELVVFVFAVDGIRGKIFQRVVHPAHVPFEAEAEAAEVGGPRDAGPGRGFFGDGENAGEAAVRDFVHALNEGDGVKIFAAAIFVGNPLALLARIVEIEHGSDGVHAKTIDVIFVEPE